MLLLVHVLRFGGRPLCLCLPIELFFGLGSILPLFLFLLLDLTVDGSVLVSEPSLLLLRFHPAAHVILDESLFRARDNVDAIVTLVAAKAAANTPANRAGFPAAKRRVLAGRRLLRRDSLAGH